MPDSTSSPTLIGPLTAEEWCAFRQRDDDLLQCCGVTSDFRDALFMVLSSGGEQWAGIYLRDEWQAMQEHGFPQGDEVTPLLDKLRVYYIDPAAAGATADGVRP